MRGVQQLIELVEFAKNLQRPGEMHERGARVTRFHASHGVRGRANPYCQILLRQVPAPTRQRDGLSEAVQAARDWQGKWRERIHLKRIFGCIRILCSQIYVISWLFPQVLVKCLSSDFFSIGRIILPSRKQYLAALRAADARDFSGLLAFARSN